MGPLLDRFGQAADKVRDPRNDRAWVRPASVTVVVLLGPFRVVVPWRHR